MLVVNWVSYFFPPNFILRYLNTFSWVGTSWPCACVFTLLSFHISYLYFPLILICFYLFWLIHVFIFTRYFCTVIFNGGVFLVTLVLIFNDFFTWIIFPVWWMLIFICLFLDDFFLLFIFSDVVVFLVFMCSIYLIFYTLCLIFTLCLVLFACDWFTWDTLK